MSDVWLQLLDSQKLLLLDGGMGTELQKRGVPMDTTAWSGAAVITHPQIVRETHEDYLRAGANVIITNTFGSTRQMLEPAGFGADVERILCTAVELAKQACENVAQAPVAVAGSISTEPPGFDREEFFSPAKEMAAYREAADLLAEAGVDVIALEMIVETEHSLRAFEAAAGTGLPVWVGLGCRKNEQGRIVSFDHPDIEFVEVVEALIELKPAAVNIMHSEVDAIPAAIELVRERWQGPLGVYPESGYFTKPDWNFVDVIEPAELVAQARAWVAAGARMLGGCCGTAPAHIAALQSARSQLLSDAGFG